MSFDPKTTPAPGTPLAGDTVSSNWWALMKLAFGDNATATRVEATVPLPAESPKLGALADVTWDGTGNPASLIAMFKRFLGLAADVTTPQPTTSYGVTASTDITRPADTTAYAAGDALADSTSAPAAGGFTLASMARANAGSGIITDIVVISSAAEALDGVLWIFDSAVTALNDNAAFSVTDANMKKAVAKIPFTTVVEANNAVAHVQALNIGFTCGTGSRDLRFLIQIKTGITPASATTYTVRAKAIGVD